MHPKPIAALAAVSLTGALLIAGCGSSSKPAYCTQVTNFENSVKTLEGVEVSASNISTISTDVQKVATSASEMASAVKGEFAPQISSVKSSVAALEATVKGVASAPSASTLSHAVTVVPGQVEALEHSAAELKEATKSKCK
jgi:hypothetical protein